MRTFTKWILGISMACCVAVLLGRVGTLYLSHNYNVAAEANGLYGALEVSEGKPLYPQKTVRPYSIYLYPPIAPNLSAALVKLVGADSLRAKVLAIRILSLLGLALALIFLWRSRPCSATASRALFTIALILGSSKLADYASSSRNDCLALALELGAFGCFIHFLRNDRVRSLLPFLLLSVAAVWTRTNAVSVFGAGVLWLLFAKRWRPAGYLICWAVILHAGILLGLMVTTNGEVWDHLVLANIRGFRPLNAEFFDLSLKSYLAGLFLFVPATVWGLREALRRGSDEDSFYLLSIGLSFLLSASVFMRAGGDVNYFFLPLLLCTFFALPAIEKMVASSVGRLALAGQLLLIATVYWMKIQSASAYSHLPYEEAARQIKKHFPPYVVLTGNYSQNMGIYLRDWAYFGPDIVNASLVAQNGHKKLRWMIKDLNRAMAEGKISAVIHVHPNCTEYGRMKGPMFDPFPILEKWNDWICVYRTTDAPALARWLP